MTYSFDVFDTLITRKTAEPIGIFVLMQDELEQNEQYKEFPEHFKEHFVEIRTNSEEAARGYAAQNNREEVTLEEIYDALEVQTGITKTERIELQNLELSLEFSNVLPIEENIVRLKQCLEDGEVFLISDMYLPEEVIRRLLVKVDRVFETIPLLVSCELGKTKSTGTLYDYFIETYHVDCDKWLHIGDNPKSDGKTVEVKGGRSELYEAITAKILGEGLIDKYRKTKAFQTVYGIIRKNWKQGNAAWQVGQRIGGPTLYAYVEWVLSEAERMGINTLYFVARDGYLLKKIADLVISKRNLQLHTSYLYGSRKAWRLPGACRDMESLKKWVRTKCGFSCLYELADTLKVGEGELGKSLPSSIRWGDAELSYIQTRAIRESVLTSGVLEKVFETGRQARENTIQYLRQEIDLSEGRIGFVELNGTGYTQRCLREILCEVYEGTTINFYYNLDGTDIEKESNIVFEKYCYRRMKCPNIVEILARAPHGQTLDYEERQDKWYPVLDRDAVEGEEQEQYEKSVLQFIEDILPYMPDKNMEEMMYDTLQLMCESPRKAEGEYLGDMPFSSTGCTGDKRRYAPVLTKKQLREILIYGNETLKGENYCGVNLTFSMARTRELYGKQIASYRKLGKLYSRLCWAKKKQRETWLEGNVILYGAGKVGKRVYEECRRSRKCKIVLWADKQYSKYAAAGYPVSNPKEILRQKYDYVVICVADWNLSMAIREELVGMGIDNSKIL